MMRDQLTLASKAVLPRTIHSWLGMGYYTLLAKLLAARNRAYGVPGRLFDLRHGVETSNVIQLHDLDLPEDSRTNAIHYQPTKIAVFRELMRRLPIDDNRHITFVDLGCGKGRCVLLAADAGFGSVTGVELSRSLCETAKRNAAIFRAGRHDSHIEIQCSDAAEARLPDAPGVYFFYNPFNERVMNAAVRNIANHLKASGHKAFIAYVNPMHKAAIETAGFRLIDSGRCRSEDWAIWHRPAA